MAAFLFRFSFSTCFLALSSDVSLNFLLLPSASAICTIIIKIITTLSSSKNILLGDDQNILARAFCVYCHNKHDTCLCSMKKSFTIVSYNHNFFFFLSPLPSAAVLLLPSSACSFQLAEEEVEDFRLKM